MIKHILKDGTVVASIDGHLVKPEKNPELYEALKKIKEAIKCE